jgi:serine/threonine protein kinase
VVEVLAHGWLDGNRSYYYIDMEYCTWTLEDYIRGAGRDRQDGDSGLPGSPVAGLVKGPALDMISEMETSPSEIKIDRAGTVENTEVEAQSLSHHDIDWEGMESVLEDILCGLIYVHGKKIVHRDLKPRNGMVPPLCYCHSYSQRSRSNIPTVLFSTSQDCWKLTDFGTATQATSKRLNTTRFARGTESYRAPEVLQTHGRFNNRADIFAIGCIIFEMLTGEKLFESDWAVLQYAQSGLSILTNRWPSSLPETRLYLLGQLTASLVARDPSSRPGAKRTKHCLEMVRTGVDSADESVSEDEVYFENESSSTSHRRVVQTVFRKRPVSHNPTNYDSNGGHGHVEQGRRVHVSNLNYEVKWPALKDYMRKGIKNPSSYSLSKF